MRLALHALALLALLACGTFPALAAEPAEEWTRLDLDRYLEDLRVEREEGWVAAQLRELRSFPHLDRAYRLLEAGDLAGARSELERYLAVDPADVRARYQLVSVLYRLGDWRAVVEQASRILDAQPDFLPALLYRGLARLRLGEARGAASDLEAVQLRAEPGSRLRRFALVQRADLALTAERWREAEGLARELVAEDATDATAHLRLARALEGRGKWPEAAAAYAAAARHAESHPTRVRALEGRGYAAQRAGNPDLAAEAFAEALALEPEALRLLRALATIEMERDRADAAVSYARRAAASPDAGARDLELLAGALLRAGELAAAVPALRRLLEGGGSPEARHGWWMSLGRALRETGDARGAIEAFEAARRLQPDAESAAELGESLARQGDRAGAIAAYRDAMEADPSPEARARWGLALARGGRPEEARVQLERAVAEGLGGSARAEALTQLGYLHESAGRYEEALSAFRQALDAGGRRAPLERAVATTLVALGRYEEAEAWLRRVLERGPDREIRRQLAAVLAAGGDVSGAISLYLDLLAERPDPGVDLLVTIANLEYERGNLRAAASFYRRAWEQSEHPTTDLAVRAVESLVGAELWDEAREVASQALEGGAEGGARLRLWRLLASADEGLGRWDDAAAARRRLVELGETGAEEYLALGLAEFRRGAWTAARDAFLSIPPGERSGAADLYLGRVYEALDRPGLAVHYYEKVVPGARNLALEDRLALLRGLGYLYFDEHEYADAADVWSRAQWIEQDPEIRVRLASAHRRVGGRSDEARRLLESVEGTALEPALESLRLRELAALDRAEGALDSAARGLSLAWDLDPDPEIQYELSQVHRERGATGAEIEALERATAAAPETARYQEALGYAYARAGEGEQAIVAFERTLALDRDVLPVYEDLAYQLVRASRNEEAIERFEQAIDNRPYHPVRTEAEREELERTQRRLRAEATTLDDSWDLLLYAAVRSEELPAATGFSLTGGVLPSQGGVELAWTPPGIGRRDGRVFQVFGRVLANLEPEGVDPISETYQGGAGLRYKPIRRLNLFLSVERLFEIGERSLDDWLVRGQFSTNFGEVLDPLRTAWNHTTLYLDAGYFVDAEVAAYFAEARQGVTFRLGRRSLITPHLVADGRYQDPDDAFSSYYEYGGGLSLVFLLSPEREYRVERGAFELLLQYKRGKFLDVGLEATEDTFDGWLATGILRF